MDLSKIFEDGRFKRCGHKYLGEDDGKKIGVVLATKSAGYDSPALNKQEFDGGRRAKRDGRIDEFYVVAAKVNGVATPKYLDHIEAEQLAAKLANETPRVGRFGEFYVLHAGIGFPATTDDDDFFM
jgi:hypothetical protein